MKTINIVLIIIFGIFLFFGGIGGCMWQWPKYKIYSQTMRGTADLREAQMSRQIIVEEARAQEEALELRANGEAKREVIKAGATSTAIEQIGVALENSPAYLRWMWISEIAGSDGERIYIATEAGMPILEAGALRNQ